MTRTAFTLLGLLVFMSAEPARAETITFAAAAGGEPPAAFEFFRTGQGSPGKWTIVQDQSAESGWALEQSSADKTDYRFPLAVYKPFDGTNVDVQIRFKPVSGTVDQAGGIVVRYLSPDNYYVVRANALENNVRFYRVVKGKRSSSAPRTPKSPRTSGMPSD